MGQHVVAVTNVSKMFRLYHERNQHLKTSVLSGGRSKYEEFWAVNDVSFDVEHGQTIGIIGHNGSGKSTLLKCLAKILVPDKGSIEINGSMAALLELGAGFHGELSGRENVFLNGSILGLSRSAIEDRFDEIVDFAGVERFIDMPIKNYSSGMLARLGFSVAINVDPEILIIDEVLSVGDAGFQRKSGEKIADFKRAGKTVIIVSHALPTLRVMCDSVVWMDGGRMVEIGPSAEVLDRYMGFSYDERESSEEPVSEEQHHGTGEVRVTKVELIGADGRPSLLHKCGDPVSVRISYNAFQRVNDPVFGFGVHTTDGAHVFGVSTYTRGVHIDYVDGPAHIDFVIDEFLLNEGAYDMRVSIVDRLHTHVYDDVQSIIRFDVRSDGYPEPGVARHPGHWDVHESIGRSTKH
jgi:ABC-type polysaccharide/polyol phosphate transport system ATPase subunit